MISRRSIALLVLLTAGAGAPGWAAFGHISQVAISASVTVSSSSLIIQATSLPSTALFGKDAVIPVQITNAGGPVNANGLNVNIAFQLLDAGGAPTGPPILLPITFSPSAANRNTLVGSAIIPSSDLKAIQHGGQLTYLFVAQQGGSGTMRNSSGQSPAPSNIGSSSNLSAFTPFVTTISDHYCGPISPAGARVSAPDLHVNDGQTAVDLAPGIALSPGTLCIKSEDATGWPAGPNGAKAAAVYSITLQDTSLSGPASLVLSYPADRTGKVQDQGADPNTLGIYWLDASNGAFTGGQWRPLSRASIDTTLHTVTGMTSHFSTFGLFATGAVGAATLRPSERIITPNGDGINDTATFSGLVAGEEVHLFDVRGRRVRTLPGPSPTWDGRDDAGKIVESGVYLYQYSSQGERVSGVIGVAK